MTTEKWQLYSQTGVDGPEYGVRIRTGYTVVGFQKEDAQAIVAWQNASIQPEGDIMEKAKALRNAALPRQTYSIPGQTGYGNPSLSKGWDFSAVDELVRVVVLELIAEVERLRSENKIISDRAAHHEKQDAAEIELLAARIKELEALNELNHKNMRSWLDTTTDKEFLDKLSSEIGFKDAYIKRLEAEFLEATGGQHHCGTQISHTGGGEWHCPKCNPLLTAEQREALEHVIEYVQETQMPISNLNEFDMQELRSLLNLLDLGEFLA